MGAFIVVGIAPSSMPAGHALSAYVTGSFAEDSADDDDALHTFSL